MSKKLRYGCGSIHTFYTDACPRCVRAAERERRLTSRTYTIADGSGYRRLTATMVVARGRVVGALMGQVTAPNAADAIAQALRQWPQLSLATTHAIPQEDVDEQG